MTVEDKIEKAPKFVVLIDEEIRVCVHITWGIFRICRVLQIPVYSGVKIE